MADETTTSTTTAKKAAPKEKDHNAEINKHLDAARDAMVESGIPLGDANAFLNAARPNGVGAVVGNFADLQRMGAIKASGAIPTLPTEEDNETDDIEEAFVEDPKGEATAPDDRLAFAHKIDKDVEVPEPTEARAKELKASAAAAAAAEKESK